MKVLCCKCYFIYLCLLKKCCVEQLSNNLNYEYDNDVYLIKRYFVTSNHRINNPILHAIMFKAQGKRPSFNFEQSFSVCNSLLEPS